jgi:OOP family OmpA-OmpF porin
MKHVAKAVLAIGAVAAGLAAGPAAAELQFGRMDTGLYLGGAVGGTRFHGACTGIPGTSCDRTDVGGKGFVGWQFTRYVGLELGYVDLGKAEESVGGVTFHTTKARGIDLVGVASYPINELFAVYGKLGGVRARVTSNLLGVTAKDTSNAFTFGAGARYNFTRNFATRLEWQRYQGIGDENTTGKGSVDFFSLGLLYGFY